MSWRCSGSSEVKTGRNDDARVFPTVKSISRLFVLQFLFSC
jgi:hypothetical protein